MNLLKKKQLAVRTLGVGKERIVFVRSRLSEIKEAITKQDIRDLQKDGAILIKEIKGRRKVKKRSRTRGPGKIRKKINKRKQEYVIMTRKLRNYLKTLLGNGEISKKDVMELRKKIRNRDFRSKAHLKEHLISNKILINPQKTIKKPKAIKKKK